MKNLASESNLFQSHSKVEIPTRLSRRMVEPFQIEIGIPN